MNSKVSIVLLMSSNSSFSYSSSSPEKSRINDRLSILKSEKEQKNEKYKAVIITNQQYEQRIKETESQIKDLSQKSQLSLSLMDDKNQKLMEISGNLQIELQKLPEEEVLEEQIFIIENYLKESKVYQSRNIENDHFVKRGVVDSNDDLEKLDEDIKTLVMLHNTRYKGIFDFQVMSKYADDETEESIAELMSTLEVSMRRTARNFLKESSKIKAEIDELQRMCDKRKRK